MLVKKNSCIFSFSSFFLFPFLSSLLQNLVCNLKQWQCPVTPFLCFGASWTVFFLTWVRDDACSEFGHDQLGSLISESGSVSALGSGAHRDATKLSCFSPSSLRSSAAVVLGLHFFLHPWQKQNSQVFISWFAALPSNRDELKPNGLGSRRRDPPILVKKHNPLKKHWTTPEITALNVGISWPLTNFLPHLCSEGPIDINMSEIGMDAIHELFSKDPTIKLGGHWKPSDCVPRWKVGWGQTPGAGKPTWHLLSCESPWISLWHLVICTLLTTYCKGFASDGNISEEWVSLRTLL